MVQRISVVRAYKRYVRVYDTIFGRSLQQGREVAVRRMNRLPGQKVLEIGVGTGLSLPFYTPGTDVVGIDLSPGMLARAKQRVANEARCRIILTLMDAENMAFSDGLFDKIVAMYAVSVTPNPEIMLSEMKRTCRPGGEIFILNHFSNGRHWPKGIAKKTAFIADIIGFRHLFPVDEFTPLLSLPILHTERVNAFGFCTLIHAKNG